MKKLFLFLFLISFSIFSAQSGIVLKDLDNKSHSIDESIGKQVVLLNFWATWCGPCKKELPIVNELYKKYKDKNFTVISVSLDEASEYSQVRSLAYGLGLTFPVLLDPDSKAADYYNPSKSAPFSILYALNGEKVKTFLGFSSSDKEELETLIVKEINRKELKKKPDFSWRFSTLGVYTRYFENEKEKLFSNYEFLTTRTHLSAFYKKYSISSSFHTNNFLSSTRLIRDRYEDNLSDLRLEKITLIGYVGKQSYTLGDFHITQGKGIALSINKQDDLGIDTTLQGINLNLIYKKLNLNLFSGFVNNTNIDVNSNSLYDDKRDLISGATFTFSPIKSITLSTNYNITMFNKPEFDEYNKEPENYKQHNLQIVGGNISYGSEKLKLYLESDFLIDNFYEDKFKRDDSYAIYASIYYTYKDFVLTQEFKKYKDFQVGFASDKANEAWIYGLDSVFYNNPVTLEREGENIKDIAGDVWGTRTNIRYKLTDNVKPYFNYLYTLSFAHDDYKKDRATHHIYLGNEYYFNDLKNKIDLSISLRIENYTEFEEFLKSDEVDNYYGFEFDSTFYITPILSLDFKGYYHFTEKSIVNESRTSKYQDAELTTTITLFKDLFISHLYNRYTYIETKPNYNAFDIKYRFFHDSYIKFFYGEIRGGLKCIGGVCKEYPAFDGFKAEVLLSF